MWGQLCLTAVESAKAMERPVSVAQNCRLQHDELVAYDDGSCRSCARNVAVPPLTGACIGGNTGLDETICNVCDDQVTIDAMGEACGVGLLKGQTFTVRLMDSFTTSP